MARTPINTARTSAGTRTTIASPILAENSFETNTTGFTAEGGTWSIVDNELNNTASQGGGIDWVHRLFLSNIDTYTDFEILAKVKKPSFNTAVVFRSGATVGSGYAIQLRDSNTFRLERWGSANLANSIRITWSTGTYYWVRIRTQGTNIKAKAWANGDSEPSNWDISHNDANYSTGRIGYSAESATGTAIFSNLTIYRLDRRIAA